MATTSAPVGRPASSAEHNLPLALTALIGRARELDAIGDVLRRTRLVSITGPGGVGKTRLALELARRQLPRRGDGVWLVDLAAIPEIPDVAAEVARVLGVSSPRGKTPTDALRSYLANRDVLLVLDNCEHVVAACAELAAALLTACRDVRIVATSRESLGVTGETVWRLDPLAAEDAYRLFVERARQRQPRFMPTAATEPAIAELCARLDRLPLAIELAAARVNVMSPAELLATLETHLGELGGADRLSPPHHRTLRAMVEWSYHLLEPADQRAFRSLAVFVAGFDAEAARSVGGLSLDLLARLVDKSLVAVVESPAGRTRYRLLETMREYAYELLVQEGELDDVRERHLRHFSTLAGPFEARWLSPRAPVVVSELGDDYENFRAALEWAAATDPCRARALLAGLKELYTLLGVADGHRLAQQLLDRCPARDRERVQVQVVFGSLAMLAADSEAARRALTEAQALSAELGERELEGWAHLFLGLTETLVVRTALLESAREHLEATRTLHDERGIGAGWARATAVLGITFLMTGEPARARELVEQALAVDVEAGDEWGQGQCHVYLGIIEESTATDSQVVTSHYREAVERLRPFRGGPLLPAALIGQAGVLVPRDPARALRVVAAAYALRDRSGAEFAPFFGARAERVRAAAEAALGADAQEIWADGARLNVDDAIALAFGGKRPPRPASPDGLSVREREVAELVAEGLSNKEIAGRLHLSVRTVESHVRHALTKTRLSNRTQLAAWARERVR